MKLNEFIEILQTNDIDFDVVELFECHSDEILDENIELDNFSDYVDKLVKLVWSKIELCQSCNEVQTLDSYNQGITENGKDMSMYRHLSSGDDVENFIQEILQFEKIHFDGTDDAMGLVNKIKTELVCPKCESEIVNEVYSKDSIDIFWSGFSRKDLDSLNGKYDTCITVDGLEKLRTDFTQNPLMLSYDNHIIKDFIKILKSVNKHDEYEIIDENQNLYRGRVFSECTNKRNENQFLMPPLLQSSHGRFNLMGESNVLYLANDTNIIPYELNYSSSNGYLYIATFKTSSKIKLIDINKIFSELPPKLFFDNSIDSRYVKEKYILPNLFAACAKYCGFDGVIYNSVHIKSSTSRNIALFNSDKVKYVSNNEKKYNILFQELK